jgi:xylulose-5-phosphate/fructose-6-phosphate phosphoketolase
MNPQHSTIEAPVQKDALPDAELDLIDACRRAANYLSVGQIYLLDNPLLTEPLRLEHVKPRLLGHWGTTPGLNPIYVHLNRSWSATAKTRRRSATGNGVTDRPK